MTGLRLARPLASGRRGQSPARQGRRLLTATAAPESAGQRRYQAESVLLPP